VPDIWRAALILRRYSTGFYEWSLCAYKKPRLNKYSGVLPCHCAMLNICSMLISLISLSVYLKEDVVFLNLYPYHGNPSLASQTTMGITKRVLQWQEKCDKLFTSLKYTWQHKKYFQKIRQRTLWCQNFIFTSMCTQYMAHIWPPHSHHWHWSIFPNVEPWLLLRRIKWVWNVCRQLLARQVLLNVS
jgi:hypothetical protein